MKLMSILGRQPPPPWKVEGTFGKVEADDAVGAAKEKEEIKVTEA